MHVCMNEAIIVIIFTRFYNPIFVRIFITIQVFRFLSLLLMHCRKSHTQRSAKSGSIFIKQDSIFVLPLYYMTQKEQ